MKGSMSPTRPLGHAVLFLVSALCEFNGREVIPPAQQTDDTFCFPSGGKTPASGTEQS